GLDRTLPALLCPLRTARSRIWLRHLRRIACRETVFQLLGELIVRRNLMFGLPRRRRSLAGCFRMGDMGFSGHSHFLFGVPPLVSVLVVYRKNALGRRGVPSR